MPRLGDGVTLNVIDVCHVLHTVIISNSTEWQSLHGKYSSTKNRPLWHAVFGRDVMRGG